MQTQNKVNSSYLKKSKLYYLLASVYAQLWLNALREIRLINIDF